MTQPLEVTLDRLPGGLGEDLLALLRDAVPTIAPAATIAIVHRGELAFEACIGWLDPEARELPVEPGTRFDLASLTKAVTATAALVLVSDGRIGLDDEVRSVIPEFAALAPRSIDGGEEPLSRRPLKVAPELASTTVDPTTVTFRQLLTHTSGLAPWRAIFRTTGPPPPPPGDEDPILRESRHAAGLEAIVGSPFVDLPGRAVHYSDLGFILLGETVRRVTRTRLALAVDALVAGQLGLVSLGYVPVEHGVRRERMAPTSVDDDWRGRRCWGEVEDENAAGLGGVAGHAGLFGTAADVARFGGAWLGRDPRLGIKKGLLAAAVTDRTHGLGAARGLGWQVRGAGAPMLEPLGEGAFGHTGFTGTSVAADPSRDVAVALLTNRVYAGRTHEGIDELRVALHRRLAGLPARTA